MLVLRTQACEVGRQEGIGKRKGPEAEGGGWWSEVRREPGKPLGSFLDSRQRGALVEGSDFFLGGQAAPRTSFPGNLILEGGAVGLPIPPGSLSEPVSWGDV